MKITETCRCGAKFDAESTVAADVEGAASRWRGGHKHASAEGICGERQPRLDGRVVVCELLAGHRGWHQEGATHWSLCEHAWEQSLNDARRRCVYCNASEPADADADLEPTEEPALGERSEP